MGNKINELEGELLFEGAKLCLNNAQSHFRSAELLANNTMYGLAISHLILSSEEAAKSLALYLKYNLSNYQGDLPEEVINYDYLKLFRNHKPKQTLAFLSSFFGLILMKANPFPVSIIDIIKYPNKKFSEDELNDIIEKKEERFNRSIQWLKSQIKGDDDLELKNNSKWWKEVNNMKNEGLYVDFKKGKWHCPDLFKKEDFEQAKKMVSGLNEFIEVILDEQEYLDSHRNQP